MRDKTLCLPQLTLEAGSFDDYRAMFGIGNINKEEKILDAAAGASSFCAQANALGYSVKACDALYGGDRDELSEKSALKKKNRSGTLKTFFDDYEINHENYIFCEFPESGFDKGEFDVVLSSHFLFYNDDTLDYDFHRETVFEMLRICEKEVRIFPLVNRRGKRSPYVRRIVKEAFDKGYGISIDKVPVKTLAGKSEMLTIHK